MQGQSCDILYDGNELYIIHRNKSMYGVCKLGQLDDPESFSSFISSYSGTNFPVSYSKIENKEQSENEEKTENKLDSSKIFLVLPVLIILSIIYYLFFIIYELLDNLT